MSRKLRKRAATFYRGGMQKLKRGGNIALAALLVASLTPWSLLAPDVASAEPTVQEGVSTVTSAHTSDFIELNLYDYSASINDKYDDSKEYPGFQWNGGAYVTYNDAGEDTYSRKKVDCIDFGNSLITDIEYSSPAQTNGKSRSAVSVGKLFNSGSNLTGKINWLWRDGTNNASITNRPVGMSVDASSLSSTLSGGYPALLSSDANLDKSLKYLFDDNDASVTKMNKDGKSIDGLFQQDPVSGAYCFNSRENHAQYDEESGNFVLYKQIITPNFILYPFGNFLPFNDITNSNKATQVGSLNVSGSLVSYFNKIKEKLGTSESEKQLSTMLDRYVNGLTENQRNSWSAKNAISDFFATENSQGPAAGDSKIDDTQLNRLYNIDWNEKTNFFFGMDMTMNFMQPKNGMTGNDNGNNDNSIDPTTNKRAGDPDGVPDYPMEFYFTGDDDVWVYIDGVLFLDLTGIHRHVGGKIDFVNGKVEYYGLDVSTGDVSSTSYKTVKFSELVSSDQLNEKGTFKDYSTHEFKFFYMERGSGSSVCRMNFNLSPLQKNSISVAKEVESEAPVLGDPDYKFQVLQIVDGEKTDTPFIGENREYTLYDKDNNLLETRTTGANGVFTLKANQRAVFTGIDENSGKYYVRELIDQAEGAQYERTSVGGEAVGYQDDVAVGGTNFRGADSPDKDISDASTAYFLFKNTVDTSKSASLSITKKLAAGTKDPGEGKPFSVEVKLDGVPLPEGTKYFVGNEEKTVQTAGIVSIPAGKTATIENILAGSTFIVEETEDSARGYNVSYSGDGVTAKGGLATGVLAAGDGVAVTVTNEEKTASVVIPGSKSLPVPDGALHDFTFVLYKAGTAEPSGDADTFTVDTSKKLDSKTVSVKDQETFSFDKIDYRLLDLEDLGGCFYYCVAEEPSAEALENGMAYIVEVRVSDTPSGESSDDAAVAYSELADSAGEVFAAGGAKAEITRAWIGHLGKEGFVNAGQCFGPGLESDEQAPFSAAFSNILVGDLKLTKKVEGIETDQAFEFEVALDAGDCGCELLPESYPATIYRQGYAMGEPATVKLVEKAGKRVFVLESAADEGGRPIALKNGEVIAISGIPYKAQWKITETNADGFVVSTSVSRAGDFAEMANGSTVSGGVTTGTTAVAFTNTKPNDPPTPNNPPDPNKGGLAQTGWLWWPLPLACAACALIAVFGMHRARKQL